MSVQRIEAIGLVEAVRHRTLIVPQLSAPDTVAHEVRRHSLSGSSSGAPHAPTTRLSWRACECSEAGVAQLLDVLVSLQVLTRHEDRYALTPSAATFLVAGRPAYAGELIMAWTGLPSGRTRPAPEPDRPRRLLDIACGCAIKSLAHAQLDPALHVTGVDASRALPVARDLAERMGLAA